MNNIVYMTEDQERSNRLEVESNLANLFRERVETKGKQVSFALSKYCPLGNSWGIHLVSC